ANHGMELGVPIFQQPETKLGIVIEDDVWIGSSVRILDGVRIAKGSIIGAGAVVNRSTIPDGIYAGVPAKMIRKRTGKAITAVETT
ncbi:MAG: acyltransferase, partial [Alphaproteobacteria bacterium]